MSEVIMAIEIDAPAERVWSLVMDPNRLADWVTIHRKLNSAPDSPPSEGDRMDQTLHVRGANFKVAWELVRCDAPRHAVWRGRGPARSHAETEYRLTPLDGRTRFAYRNEFRAPMGLLGAAASRALVGGVPEREAWASLKRLKAIAEQE
jgi:uncharacterized protein YndB with AHSA1/START domain